jgi:hypothetical protein
MCVCIKAFVINLYSINFTHHPSLNLVISWHTQKPHATRTRIFNGFQKWNNVFAVVTISVNNYQAVWYNGNSYLFHFRGRSAQFESRLGRDCPDWGSMFSWVRPGNSQSSSLVVKPLVFDTANAETLNYACLWIIFILTPVLILSYDIVVGLSNARFPKGFSTTLPLMAGVLPSPASLDFTIVTLPHTMYLNILSRV